MEKKIEVSMEITNIEQVKSEIEEVVELLKEANSLCDELASKFNINV